MLNYLIGISLCIPLYYYRRSIIYYFILYFDKLLTHKQKKITCTGINKDTITHFNYCIDKDYFKYDIIIVNFSINNKSKRILYNSNIDFSLLESLPNYISPIILSTIELWNNEELIKTNTDITTELNEFILYDCDIQLTNSKLDKLLWISIINNKYNTNYSKDLTLIYSIMKQDITTINNKNINIATVNGIITVI